MKIGALFLMFYAQWYFYNISIVDSTPLKDSYYEYVKKIVNYVRQQPGWHSIYKYRIHYDKKGTLADVQGTMSQNPRKNNLPYTFNAIVNLICYKYSDKAREFVKMITMFIDECKLNELNGPVYIHCATSLEYELARSFIMLDHMYKTLTFLSYVDLRLATNVTSSDSRSLIEAIHNIKTYVNKNMTLLNQPYESLTYSITKNAITSLTEFFENAFNNVPEYRGVFVYPPERKNLKAECDHDYEIKKGNFKSFYSYMCQRLEEFYTKVLYDEYQALGFIPFTYAEDEV